MDEQVRQKVNQLSEATSIHDQKLAYILNELEGVNMKGIQQFCTNLHNSFTANPPATEKKLIDTVGGLPSRAEVEKITQSIAEIGELRKLIGKVETEALQRMA